MDASAVDKRKIAQGSDSAQRTDPRKRPLRHVAKPDEEIELPSISFIVARSNPGHVIGCENRLPWHLRTDLLNFKSITSGHVVILGRKTLDSIGRPLPNRDNVVISRNDNGRSENVFWASSREKALFTADHLSIKKGLKEFFVIGGAEIYKSFFDLFNKIYLTEVYAGEIVGDAFFDYDFNSSDWELRSRADYEKSNVDEYPFSILVYEKKKQKNRFCELSKFMTDQNIFAKQYNVDVMGNKVKRDHSTHFADLFD